MSEELRLQLLFAKYLDRSCSPQELEELLYLLERAESDEHLTEPMQELWEKLKNDKTEYAVDWQRMYASVTSTADYPESLLRISGNRPKWWKYAVAASLLSFVVLAVYWINSRSAIKKGPQQIASIIARDKETKMASNRQTIHLPDGSTVILNTGSTLNYPSGFTHNRRDVYLSGEGFFDIKHDPRTPFFVHIGKLSVKVLGTAFNIKADAANEKIEVTVTRGKVQVLKENKSVGVIVASQQLSFTPNTGSVITQTVDTLPIIAWKPAEIYFNDITMEDATRKITARFGVPVEFVHASAKNCRVTATFSEDDLVEEILTVICAVSKTEFTITNNKIIIDGKGCD